MLRLRDSDPPRFAFCQMTEVQLNRRAITIYGGYVVSNLEQDHPAILGEYWAEDGITVVNLYPPPEEE